MLIGTESVGIPSKVMLDPHLLLYPFMRIEHDALVVDFVAVATKLQSLCKYSESNDRINDLEIHPARL
jgi:hypothetical protein